MMNVNLQNITLEEYRALLAMRTKPARPSEALTLEDMDNLPVLMRRRGRPGPWDDPAFDDLIPGLRRFRVFVWAAGDYYAELARKAGGPPAD